MLRKHRTKEKRRFAVLLMALAVLLASPPDMRAQSDAYFEAEDFGDNYAYGFSHEGYGSDIIYNFTHQIYGDDYLYNFSHQIYGSDYIYDFSHQVFGDDYIYSLTHEGFGDDYTGNFNHQGFGEAPLGSGIFILLAAGTCYAVKRSKKQEVRSKKPGHRIK